MDGSMVGFLSNLRPHCKDVCPVGHPRPVRTKMACIPASMAPHQMCSLSFDKSCEPDRAADCYSHMLWSLQMHPLSDLSALPFVLELAAAVESRRCLAHHPEHRLLRKATPERMRERDGRPASSLKKSSLMLKRSSDPCILQTKSQPSK